MSKLTKAQKALINDARSMFKNSKNRDLNIADELLITVLENGREMLEEMDDDQTVAFLLKAEAENTKIAAAPIDPGISNLAHKLDQDMHATQMFRENIEAVMTGKQNSVTCYADFKRIFTKDELDAMPYPGTDKDSPYLGNFKPDIVKTIAKSGPQVGQEITVTWTNDFVSALAIGKQYETIMDNAKKELENGGSVPAYKGWGKADLKAELSDATARRNALRSMVKRAIELHHMFEGVKGMAKVNIRWIKSKGEDNKKFISMPVGFGEEEPSIKVTRAPKNLWIFPEGEPENGREFSVTQLLAFDVATANANGGTLDALIATGRKGKAEGEEKEGDGVDMTEMEAYANMARTINFLNKRENNANVLRILADKSHPEHKDWVELIGDSWGAFYTLARRIKTEYEALKETKLEGLVEKEAA